MHRSGANAKSNSTSARGPRTAVRIRKAGFRKEPRQSLGHTAMLLASHAAPSARWPGGLSSTRAARRRRQHVAASSSGGADTINGAGDSRRAVVVGGGWAGFAAALALAKAGAQVILLDAADNPGARAHGRVARASVVRVRPERAAHVCTSAHVRSWGMNVCSCALMGQWDERRRTEQCSHDAFWPARGARHQGLLVPGAARRLQQEAQHGCAGTAWRR